MTDDTAFDVFACPLTGVNLIEAAAGTGKTWNICALYLRLLLESRREVREILVVTFTNAATAELRERVRKRLLECLDHLHARGPEPADPFVPELVARAERAGIARSDMITRLELARESFDEAAIFTIHGFCQRALAETPFAAGAPFAMELVPDDREMQLEVAQDFWRTHVAGADLPLALAAYLAEKKDSPRALAELLGRRVAKPLARVIWPDDIARAPSIDTAPLEQAFAAARATWQSAREEVQALLLAAASVILNKTKYRQKALRRAFADWQAYFDAGDPLAPIPKDAKLDLCAATTLRAATHTRRTPPAHAFCDRADELLAARAALHAELAHARLQLLRRLLEEGPATLRARKRVKRVLAYDDILFKLYAALHAPDGAALAGLLRARYPAALIDEFQDTDPVQFGIFEQIYAASEVPLFLVGDPKQAIYGFRNADLHTYLQARRLADRDYTLSDNQRASADLIAGINALFDRNPRAFVLEGLAYHDASMGAKPRQALVDRTPMARADCRIWMLPQDEGGVLDHRAAMDATTTATVAEIARLLHEGNAGRIDLAGAPLRPRDIAVLVRSHAQGAKIRDALRDAGIGSVELSQVSVFASPDAEEVERVLLAVLNPSHAGYVKSALATELLGYDAASIRTLGEDEAALMDTMAGFDGYRALWLERGVGLAYRHLLSQEGVSARMLARTDGERRLTNLLHIGERLHEAAMLHPAPDGLLRWLDEQRTQERAEEAAQLRLESDRNLVRIVTVHKAKGLEYPVVFCPFAWDGRSAPNRDWLGARSYHDAAGTAVIDFRDEAQQGADASWIASQMKREALAEAVRLLYVATTRASHRLYVVGGCYASRGAKKASPESTRSMLNWLVAGAGASIDDWCSSPPDADDVLQAWRALARDHPRAMTLEPLPCAAPRPLPDEWPAPETLTARRPPAGIRAAWRIGSYSGLVLDADAEAASVDHDLLIASRARGGAPADLPPDDILAFPRGPLAGECLHAVLEHADFADPATWPAAIEQALAGAAFASARGGRARLVAMVGNMLRDVTNTVLPSGVRLGEVTRSKRLSELEFSLPTQGLSPGALNAMGARHGYAVPRFAFAELHGYVKGFIDLVFEHAGRFYIADWKSNHLGYRSIDYGPEAIASAMFEHGYHLQHLLYSLALHRHLSRRIAHYRFETHFGGVFYLFLRGMRPGWQLADGAPAGVYFHRLSAAALDDLERLFGLPQEALA